ncbi:recombinase family protein [Gramella lutea]|uniref:Recombinase family protein n=2 Tax=Christiangramia lutea TaxID=1607951 RepID=A0A9X1V3C2_9FLAO|nr:recombinase family protein [Christiangramia lutea]
MLGIYCRISQDKEEGENRSIKNQAELGIEKAKELNIQYLVFKDEGISGTVENINDRPGLKQLIAAIAAKEISSVFVTDHSRLERNPRVGFAIKDIFRKHSIKFYTSEGEVNLSDPTVDLVSNLYSLFNEYYVKNTQRKIKQVLKHNVKKGKIHGIIPYGYCSDENGIMQINEEEREVVERIYSLSLEGKGTSKIAEILTNEGIPTRYNKLNKGTLTIPDRYDPNKFKVKRKSEIIWSGKTVRDIIKNEVYKGVRVYSGGTYDCPAIFSNIYWNKVNQNLPKNRNNKGKKVDHKYMLKGIIKCGRCGENMYGRTRTNKKDNYYMCSSKRYPQKKCDNRSINIDILEGLIWEQFFKYEILLKSYNEYFENKEEDEKLLLENLQNLRSKKKVLASQKQRAIRLTIEGKLNEDDITKEIQRIENAINDINLKIERNEERLEVFSSSKNNIYEIRKITNLAKKRNVSWVDKRNLIRTYIQKVMIYFDGKRTYAFSIQLKFNPKKKIYYVMDAYKRIPYIDMWKVLQVRGPREITNTATFNENLFNYDPDIE